ncbi:MAG: lysophospholipase [Anaerolineae bacterium]|nr:lysophospholipase [Anaerolineae bacterium]
MDHSEGTFQASGDVELYYQRWRPDGIPRASLAIVHGFGEHSGRYGNVVDWFLPRGHAIYALDQRGYGRSPGSRGYVKSFAEYRQDLSAFLDLVRDAEAGRPLYLLGHSMGGLVVLNYVLHDPSGLDGVIASAPLLGTLPTSPLLTLLSKGLSHLWPGLTLETGLEVAALSRDRAVVDAYVNDPLVHNLGTPRLGTEFAKTIEWTQDHAADLALPCLILHGGADRLVDPEASRTFFEKVTFADKVRHEYEGSYHEIFNDLDKEVVFADMEAWLDDHLRRDLGVQ